MTLSSLFAETRLAASVACRASTFDHGCFSAREWESAFAGLPAPRIPLERARLRISAALSTEGIDPVGVGRALLIHESAAPLSRAALRDVGFVHLESASGIHLYALWGAYEIALARVAARWNPRVVGALRTVPPLVAWAVVFGLAGFRPGLLRPLVLVLARWASARFGIRWARAAPIALALAFDAMIGFLLSFGSERAFVDWAPGELHYAAAWWGGILGYDYARARGWGRFRAHAVLSLASWIAVLPLDLASGKFALATPLLSLLTVEFLVRGGYLALFGLACAVGFGANAWAVSGLCWSVALFDRGVAEGADFLARNGFLRFVPEGFGEILGLVTGVLASCFALAWAGKKPLKAGTYAAPTRL